MAHQSLTLSQSQQMQMVLAPQLRQSLEMLQAPMLELRAMIQSEIEQNPTIEEIPIDTPTVEIEPPDSGTEDVRELDFDKEFEMIERLDDEWRDYFFEDLQSRPYNSESEEKRQHFMDSLQQQESLQEHLMAQLHIAEMSDRDQQVGELIIGSLDDDGYLTVDMTELAESTGTSPEHLEDILAVIQDFHPTGVAARNLRECLLLQIEKADMSETLEAEIIKGHLDKLGVHKIQDIARALKVTPEQVDAAAQQISHLNPKPGSLYSETTAAYVLPEVLVDKIDGEYELILNDDQLPRVRISNHYREMLASSEVSDETKKYIKEKITAGAFLIKSIHQRQSTINRIAGEIVQRQKEFLENGVSQLRPMTMSQVAEIVGVHETTVSRCVNGKYMKTPSGVFEMKYFFTPGLKTSSGETISNKAVKDIIGGMVADEDPESPLSDQAIMAKLKEQGITIARRTVAKYRLMLKIPPSHMRKRF